MLKLTNVELPNCPCTTDGIGNTTHAAPMFDGFWGVCNVILNTQIVPVLSTTGYRPIMVPSPLPCNHGNGTLVLTSPFLWGLLEFCPDLFDVCVLYIRWGKPPLGKNTFLIGHFMVKLLFWAGWDDRFPIPSLFWFGWGLPTTTHIWMQDWHGRLG